MKGPVLAAWTGQTSMNAFADLFFGAPFIWSFQSWRIPECGSVLTELLGNNGSCVPSLKRLATMRELRGSTRCTAPSIYHAEPPELAKIQGCSLISHISKAALAYCTDVFFSPLLPPTHFLVQDSGSLEEYCYIIPCFPTIGLSDTVYALLWWFNQALMTQLIVFLQKGAITTTSCIWDE